jgi:glutamyl aminopeptidase
MRQKRVKNATLDTLDEHGVVIDIRKLKLTREKCFLEVGSGKGKFISQMALDFPHIDFVAFEININVCYRIMEKKTQLNLDNLTIVLGDASHLDGYFNAHSIDAIFLNFSDPWPKVKHHRRRLTYPTYLKIYQHLLKSSGYLQFRTDRYDLFLDSLTYISSHFDIIEQSLDQPSSRYMTEYEEKKRSFGPIYQCIGKVKPMINPLYKELFDLPGIASYENQVRQYMRKFLEKLPNIEIETDRLGSIFAVKKAKDPNAPKVMIAGHMDEVGLMVVGITDLGMIKMQPVGSLPGEVFVSQVLNVYTQSGMIKGVVGAIPPHMKTDQKTSFDELLLDIGASSKEEAKSFGVELGNMVLFDNLFCYTKNPYRLIAKGIDNRYGCGLALETIKHFADKELDFTLICGATVQEEVGLRGAETATNYFAPDLFIALDASPVGDATDKDFMGGLNKGFLVRIYDPRNVMHQGLMRYFVELAESKEIRYQYFTSKGGTDAAKALDANQGIPATTIGLPTRYIHSTASMMDTRDLDSARQMVYAIIEDLTPQKIKSLKESNE